MKSESRSIVCPHRLAATVSVAALLAGCAVGPDFKRPDAKPPNGYTSEKLDLQAAAGAEAKQNLAIGKKISGQWWELYRSQRLNDVLSDALANNQNLVAARATLAQAKQVVDQAAGALWPRVQFGATASRNQTNQASLGFESPHVISNFYNIGPNVSYALDLFGLTRRQVEQQEALTEYQEYQLDAAYLILCGQVVNQAIGIASARQQITIVQEIIKDDQDNLKNVSDQLSLGEATRTDVEQARSQLNADRALLPPLQQQIAVAKHALAILVGKAPAEWVAPDFDLNEFTLPEELPVSVPSELVRQRPDILSAEAQLHAASAAIGVATAQMFPNITLSASFAQQALDPGNLFLGASSIWSIGSQLTAPLFQGGALNAQRLGAIENFKAKAAGYQQTVLASFGQVADTLTALENDAQLLDRQRAASESAETTRGLMRETYRSGGVTVLQVLDAERQYAQARLGYTRARAQRFVDTSQLFNAMGGGWWDWRANDIGMAAKATAVSATKP